MVVSSSLSVCLFELACIQLFLLYLWINVEAEAVDSGPERASLGHTAFKEELGAASNELAQNPGGGCGSGGSLPFPHTPCPVSLLGGQLLPLMFAVSSQGLRLERWLNSEEHLLLQDPSSIPSIHCRLTQDTQCLLLDSQGIGHGTHVAYIHTDIRHTNTNAHAYKHTRVVM